MKDGKKAYEKPGMVFCNFKTGEMKGTVEMIEKIEREAELAEREYCLLPAEPTVGGQK